VSLGGPGPGVSGHAAFQLAILAKATTLFLTPSCSYMTNLFEHPFVSELLARSDPGTIPVTETRGDIVVVTYSSTRLTFRRDAFRKLPAGGVLLIRVRPKSQTPYDVAMTREDFEGNFHNIIASDSWRERGIYDCKNPPPAARAYLRLAESPS
jgi:hypothetical protein